MARVLALHPPLAAQTLLVFFDGEEAYENFTDTDGLYGSRYFAAHLPRPKNEIRGGLLLDMMGDRSLTITLSPDSPPQMTLDIFASAETLKLRDHFTYFQSAILDDHSPLNAAGITTIDLIDSIFRRGTPPMTLSIRSARRVFRSWARLRCIIFPTSPLNDARPGNRRIHTVSNHTPVSSPARRSFTQRFVAICSDAFWARSFAGTRQPPCDLRGRSFSAKLRSDAILAVASAEIVSRETITRQLDCR